jgi:hypothetical protein
MVYQVGYGKPPLHTRFRKGQSGNPSGRPRLPQDVAAVLRRALDRKAPAARSSPQGTPPGVPEAAPSGGPPSRRRRRGTWREAVIAGLVERAAGGDVPAMRLLIDLICRLEPEIADPEPTEEEVEDARERLIRALDRLAAEQQAQGADLAGEPGEVGQVG